MPYESILPDSKTAVLPHFRGNNRKAECFHTWQSFKPGILLQLITHTHIKVFQIICNAYTWSEAPASHQKHPFVPCKI